MKNTLEIKDFVLMGIFIRRKFGFNFPLVVFSFCFDTN